MLHPVTLKFIVEKHRDGYVAYPLGLKGGGEGDSYDSALAGAKSAAAFHIVNAAGKAATAEAATSDAK
jgi:hypothetical protein